jgi:YVTN family beta-propeller protein
MTSLRAAFIAALLSIFLISCGDTFRPIANPVPGSIPTPQSAKTAVAITSDGKTTQFNLSGATISGQANVGPSPTAAVFTSSLRIYVANSGNSTVNFYTATSPQSGMTTITLPTDAKPQLLAGGTLPSVYVGYGPGQAKVGVVSLTSNTLVGEISIGADPIAMQSSSDGKKLFVAKSDGTVAVVDTATNAVATVLTLGGNCAMPSLTSIITSGAPFSPFSIKPDGTYVYLACQDSGNLFWINASTNAFTDVAPAAVGAAPNFVTYDAKNNRVVVTNSLGNTVSIISEDTSNTATLHQVIGTVPVGNKPVSATALADGSKIYVANQGTSNVTVINSSDFTVKTTIPLAGPPQQILSSTDSLRVAVSVSGTSPNVTSIDTTTEAVSTTFPLTGAPVSLLLLPI